MNKQGYLTKSAQYEMLEEEEDVVLLLRKYVEERVLLVSHHCLRPHTLQSLAVDIHKKYHVLRALLRIF